MRFLMVMMVLARAMNASITRVRTSAWTWSLPNPRVCHESVSSITWHRPACKGAPPGDPGVAARQLEQFTGLATVVAGIQVHGDALGQVEAEPAQTIQGGFQQGRVMAVGGGDHHSDGDAVLPLGHDRTLGALLATAGR